MLSRGGGSKHKYPAVVNKNSVEEIYGAETKVDSRGKPIISSLNSGANRLPAFNNSSVAGAGYNSKQPYLGAKQAPGVSSLNNVFNIPKYGQGGLGGGIGGSLGGGIGSGIGTYGALGGGMGGFSSG